jgi:hypothetical protein
MGSGATQPGVSGAGVIIRVRCEGPGLTQPGVRSRTELFRSLCHLEPRIGFLVGGMGQSTRRGERRASRSGDRTRLITIGGDCCRRTSLVDPSVAAARGEGDCGRDSSPP